MARGGRWSVRAPAERGEVLRVALAGKRRVLSTSNGGIVAIGVPLTGPSGAAIVALSRRPDVPAAIGIVSDQALRGGVIAGVIGVLGGVLLAQVVAVGLRRRWGCAPG